MVSEQRLKMGCSPSCHTRVAPGVDESINQEMQMEAREFKNTVKILLLGEGESGKSTIAKQMRILHCSGYSQQDLRNFKILVHSNAIDGLLTILKAMETLNISFHEQSASDNAKSFFQNVQNSHQRHITPVIAILMKSLWNDKDVQCCYIRSNEYQLIDCAGYYLNKLEKISEPFYVPNEQDVLRTRVRTLGIVETRFILKNLQFRMVDVGGQRAHRRKWIHCFEGVAAMIFCVALSGYDLTLAEDGKTNRMQESLQLFKAMYTSKWFVNTSIILLLNKRDIFEEKIQRWPLTICFPEYDGPSTYSATTMYIRIKFEEVKEKKTYNDPKSIYTHITCATDTPGIEAVFDTVSDIAIQNTMNECGLY